MTDFQPTKGQSRAIQIPVGTIVVSAGAGTGKTSVLSEVVAREMVAGQGQSVRNVLVLTFTRKAAVEMAERIESRLRFLANQTTGAERDRLLRAASEVADAAIETLDAFAARLLREYAASAGIDPAFEVMDPFDCRRLGEEVAEQCLERWSESPPHELWPKVASEISVQSWAQLLNDLDSHLMTRGKPSAALVLTGNGTHVHVSEALDRIVESHQARFDRLRRDVIGTCKALKDPLQKTAKKGTGEGKSYGSLAERILATLNPLTDWMLKDPLDWDDPVVSSVVKWKFWGGRFKEGAPPGRARELGQDVRKHITGEVADTDKDVYTLRGLDLDLRLLDHRQALAAALLDFHESFKAERRRRGVLSFADCELEAIDLLNRDEQVRDALRDRFKYVVVDEYQDINPLQQELIFALSHPGEDEIGLPENLYVVGDERQSVFGFRGAVCDLLIKLREKAESEERDGAGSRVLHESFRARRELLNLVNHVFRQIWGSTGLHRDLHPAFDPYIKAEPGDLPGEARIELHLVEAENADTGREKEAIVIASRLAEIVREKQPQVWKREEKGPSARPIQWGDCAVLVRKRAMLRLYEEAFAALDIPAVSEAGGGFWDRAEIADIQALLSCLSPASENLDWAVLLRSPWVGLSDGALLEIAENAGKERWRDVLGETEMPSEDDEYRLESFRAWFAELARFAGRVPITRLLEEALERSGYAQKMFKQDRGQIVRLNIEKLLERFRSRGDLFDPSEAADYIRWLRESEVAEAQASVASEVDGGAVTLATVHVAKGREWPLVVVPDLGRKRSDGRRGSELVWWEEIGLTFPWTDPHTGRNEKPASLARAKRAKKEFESKESLRLLYVALTRAREWLILSSGVKKDEKKKQWSREETSWLAELEKAFRDSVALLEKPSDGTETSFVIHVAEPRDPEEDDGEPIAPNKRGSTLHVVRTVHTDVQPLPLSRTRKTATKEDIDRLQDALDALTDPPAPTSRRYLLTVSEIAAFERCPRMYAYSAVWMVPGQWRYTRHPSAMESGPPDEVETERGEPAAEVFELPASVWGTLCHEVLERVPLDADLEAIRSAATETLTRAGYDPQAPLPESLGGPSDKTTAERLTGLVSGALGLPVLQRIRDTGHVGREFRLLGTIDESDEIVLGTIDLYAVLDDGPIVVDYKSGRVELDWIPGRMKDYALQLALYAHLAAGRERVDPAEVEAHVVFLDPPRDEVLGLDDALLGRAVESVQKLAEASINNDFPATPKRELCSRCDYREICPYSMASG